MKRTNIRTLIKLPEEAKVSPSQHVLLSSITDQWIEDLEFKLRYSKEETQVYQGALRALYDIRGIISPA